MLRNTISFQKNWKKAADMSPERLKEVRKQKALADRRYNIWKEAREMGLPEEEVEWLVKQADGRQNN